MRKKVLVPFVMAAVLLAPPASAQQAGRGEAAAVVQEQFQSSGLKIGSPFPEMDIYDDEGRPFNTRSLKGKYTVVVNGCLT